MRSLSAGGYAPAGRQEIHRLTSSPFVSQLSTSLSLQLGLFRLQCFLGLFQRLPIFPPRPGIADLLIKGVDLTLKLFDWLLFFFLGDCRRLHSLGQGGAFLLIFQALPFLPLRFRFWTRWTEFVTPSYKERPWKNDRQTSYATLANHLSQSLLLPARQGASHAPLRVTHRLIARKNRVGR